MSPRVRELFDSCVVLERKIEWATRLIDVGLIPPLEERRKIKALATSIIDGISAITKKDKEIEEELEKVRKEMSFYEKEMLKITVTSPADLARYGSFLAVLTDFVFSFVLPVFSSLARQMAINPDAFWETQHNEFTKRFKYRLGKRPEIEKEEGVE